MTPPPSATTARDLDQAALATRQGRASEAEAIYRRVLGREPSRESAAVALARLLIDQGRAEEAEGHLRPFTRGTRATHTALSARAAALKALGRPAESLADYIAAAKLAPDSGVAAHNVAAGHGDAGRDAEAVIAAERAFQLGLDAPETWLVYGRALQGLQRFDEARAAFERAVARRPAYAEAIRDLGQLIWMRGAAAEAALGPVETALAGARDDPALILVKTRLLEHAVDEAAALAFARAAWERTPHDPALTLEVSRLSLRRFPNQAHDLAQRVVSGFPNAQPALRALCHARLALGEARGAADIAQALIDHDDHDQQAVADLVTAWRLAGDERATAVYDYGRMVQAAPIDLPRGWSRLEDYLFDLGGALTALHALRGHPIDQSLRGGTQSAQNLTLSDNPIIQAFFRAIEGPIAAYRDAVGRGEDLFRRRNRGPHRLHGAWSVRLAPRGFHVDHIHPEGWVSSACYVDVPTAILDSESKQGWLRFGQPPTPTAPTLEAEHFVRPEPGLLALFPSYMWHGTVPFGGDHPRLTIAFDLVSIPDPAPARR